jgi:hypothetical protein
MVGVPRTIKYTRHAKRRMRWRNISERDVEDALVSPDKVEWVKSKQYNAYTNIQGRILKVGYKEEDEVAVIITALWKGE